MCVCARARLRACTVLFASMSPQERTHLQPVLCCPQARRTRPPILPPSPSPSRPSPTWLLRDLCSRLLPWVPVDTAPPSVWNTNLRSSVCGRGRVCVCVLMEEWRTAAIEDTHCQETVPSRAVPSRSVPYNTLGRIANLSGKNIGTRIGGRALCFHLHNQAHTRPRTHAYQGKAGSVQPEGAVGVT